jgi:hypothetical protein
LFGIPNEGGRQFIENSSKTLAYEFVGVWHEEC